MHENNRIRNLHAKRRAEIVLSFDVLEAEATEEFLNAIVGVIRREIGSDLGKSAEVKGKWL